MKTNLAALRRESGITQQAVADALGVPVRTYASWERGEREFNLEDAVTIAELYKCSVDYLIGSFTKEQEDEYQTKRRLEAALARLNAEGLNKTLDYVIDLDASGRYSREREYVSDNPIQQIA